MPFLLREGGVPYAGLALFSLSGYPFSLKVLWSPVVDSVWSQRIGRRKSWIIPVQLMSACILWLIGSNFDTLVDPDRIGHLTLLFLLLVMLVATQDVAVDGWALTMLRPEHVGWASTCQSIGISAGFFTSFTVLLALNSAEFSNTFLRAPHNAAAVGVLSVALYMKIWASIYVLVTLLLLLKNETTSHQPSSILNVYQCMLSVLRLPQMRRLILVLLFARIGSAAADNVTMYKIIERGLRKDHLALFALIQFPWELLFVWIGGRWAQQPSGPFKPWLICYRVRLLASIVGAVFVWQFPAPNVDWVFLAMLLIFSLVNSFVSEVMFTSLGVFFAQIGDPAIGGAYLTLLNTVMNFGAMWPRPLMLWLVDILSKADCSTSGSCVHQKDRDLCAQAGGICTTQREGFYYVIGLCFVIGFALFPWLKRELEMLGKTNVEDWRCAMKKKNDGDVEQSI